MNQIVSIESLVREKMDALDLERDVGENQAEVAENGTEATVFERTPGLSFTRILSAKMDGNALVKSNWAGLLLEMVKRVKTKGISSDRLAV